MSTYFSEKTYEGPEAIAVAMDIGTTHSAVSFVYFVPGSQPRGRMVDYYRPGNATAKTPSVILYKGGIVKACGAVAEQDFAEHSRSVAHRFKLHLHTALIPQFSSSESETPPLPVGITIDQVYADMMQYLMENTRVFFQSTNPNGAEIWMRLRDAIIIILTIPNGWGIWQQATLIEAVIRASLVTRENVGELVKFMTESETFVHYALATQAGTWLKERSVFAVIDCGDSTVDITIYRCVSTSPLSLTEAFPSECVQAGGSFNREVENMLEDKLNGSLFTHPDIIKSMIGAFEMKLKPTFNGDREEYKFKFGADGYNDQSLGIHKGTITLSNQELKPIFDTAIARITTGCLNTLIIRKPEYVLLVGEFGVPPYVQNFLLKWLKNHEMKMITVEDNERKAVASGAIIGHINRSVIGRVARATLGGHVRQIYDNTLHHEPGRRVQLCADGKQRVDGVFERWIEKGTVLPSTFAHRFSHHTVWDAASMSQNDLRFKLGTIEIEVFAWEGGDIPTWCRDAHGAVMSEMCSIGTLNADLSALAVGLPSRNGPAGNKFYRVDYDVYIYLERAQLCAKLQWREGGVLREGLVKVIHCVS